MKTDPLLVNSEIRRFQVPLLHYSIVKECIGAEFYSAYIIVWDMIWKFGKLGPLGKS